MTLQITKKIGLRSSIALFSTVTDATSHRHIKLTENGRLADSLQFCNPQSRLTSHLGEEAISRYGLLALHLLKARYGLLALHLFKARYGLLALHLLKARYGVLALHLLEAR